MPLNQIKRNLKIKDALKIEKGVPQCQRHDWRWYQAKCGFHKLKLQRKYGAKKIPLDNREMRENVKKIALHRKDLTYQM